ncbi:MAG: hypothetical protein KJ718_00240 [Nanoarchaeota archaeon]|nr:hypothetical protein [Nanoarchaeota archaeon]MBU1050969.1 hypothetical protein [Nanoarchaeota archaeon]
MKKQKRNKLLYWIPRVLAIVFILFLRMFAFDVFAEYEFPLVLGALFMHLLPTFAWRRENTGGWLFIILGVGFTFFFETYESPVAFLLISGPVFLIGILFLWNYHRNLEKRIE